MRRILAGLLVGIGPALSAAPDAPQLAAGDGPIAWRNSGTGHFAAGLPRAADARLPGAGVTLGDLSLEIASQFAQDTEGGEDVLLDAETTTVLLAVEHGFGGGWSASAELPWIRHDGGFLDGLINDYHDLLGLPDAGRGDAPEDEVNLIWRDGSGVRFARRGEASGIGDVRLGLARSLLVAADRDVALRLGVELPTGDAGDPTGSDSWDVSLAVHITDRRWLAEAGWTVHAAAGVLRQGDDEITDRDAEDWVGWGSFGLVWPLAPRWSLKGQLDAHTATADTRLREIGGWSVQGGLALAVDLGRRWSFEGAFVEDLRPGSAPDIAFRFALRGAL